MNKNKILFLHDTMLSFVQIIIVGHQQYHWIMLIKISWIWLLFLSKCEKRESKNCTFIGICL